MQEKLFKDRYRVSSARLPDYDYSKIGYYFVTLCTKNRECAFGRIENDYMILSDIGKIVDRCWKEIPSHFDYIRLDEYVVMPNHLHGILVLEDKNDSSANQSEGLYSKISPKQGSLSSVIRSFKSAVTNAANRTRPDQSFYWQSRFYDRVIRNDDELLVVRRYIRDNPVKWALDEDNSVRMI